MQSNSLNRPGQLISSRMVGVLVLVFIEIMFFSALISSYFVMKKGREIWDAAGSIHLPVLATGFNTVILFASGISLFFAGRALKSNQNKKLAAAHLFRTIILACFFLAFQIYLGAQLINSGLTISSSVFGGCYHLIIGTHLVQVLIGIVFMFKLHQNMTSIKPSEDQNAPLIMQDYCNSLQMFWLFVMGIWPVLYAEIYF